jgi:hypothetical protein
VNRRWSGRFPKVPYVGYAGQFDDDPNWDTVHRKPVTKLEVKPLLDATGQNVLPLPRREVWEPPIQAMELAKESARRAIQAAMGISNLPTAAQRKNEKSGVALDKIESQQQRGSYHFVDNFDRGLKKAGFIMDEVLDKVETSARDVGIVHEDDTYEVTQLDPEKHYKGKHAVVISVGPDFASQQQEAEDFLNILARDPALFARVGDLVTRMKRLGPIGDQIAERLVPPEFALKGSGRQAAPAGSRAGPAESQSRTSRAHEYAKKLEGELSSSKEQQAKGAGARQPRAHRERRRSPRRGERASTRHAYRAREDPVERGHRHAEGGSDALKARHASTTRRAAREADQGAKAIESGND